MQMILYPMCKPGNAVFPRTSQVWRYFLPVLQFPNTFSYLKQGAQERVLKGHYFCLKHRNCLSFSFPLHGFFGGYLESSRFTPVNLHIWYHCGWLFTQFMCELLFWFWISLSINGVNRSASIASMINHSNCLNVLIDANLNLPDCSFQLFA